MSPAGELGPGANSGGAGSPSPGGRGGQGVRSLPATLRYHAPAYWAPSLASERALFLLDMRPSIQARAMTSSNAVVVARPRRAKSRSRAVSSAAASRATRGGDASGMMRMVASGAPGSSSSTCSARACAADSASSSDCPGVPARAEIVTCAPVCVAESDAAACWGDRLVPCKAENCWLTAVANGRDTRKLGAAIARAIVAACASSCCWLADVTCPMGTSATSTVCVAMYCGGVRM
jgi:hypothetical protein